MVFKPSEESLEKFGVKKEKPEEPHKSVIDQIDDTIPRINLESTDLPSKGMLYPKGCEIIYKPYTYGEVTQVSNSKLSVKQNFELILKGIETSFDKNKLTLSDFLYIGLLRRLSTLGGTEFDCVYVCRHCNENKVGSLKTTELEFEEITAPEFPISFKTPKGILKFKPITVGQYSDLLRDGKESDEIAKLSLECFDHPNLDVYDYIQNCPSNIGRVFDRIDKLMAHGLKSHVFTCSDEKCKKDTRVDLDGREVAILLPFRKSKSVDEGVISFGE